MSSHARSSDGAQRDRRPGAARVSAAAGVSAGPASQLARAGRSWPGVRHALPSQVPVAAAQAVADFDDPLESEARSIADRFAGQQELAGLPERMGRALDFDFSRVRVHTGQQAAESASGLRAAAYTVGDHIVLGPGYLSAAEPRRSWLLAHELAHVVQHADGRGTRVLHRQPELVPELDKQLSDALANSNWKLAAEILNRFSPDDIDRRVGQVPGWTGLKLAKGQVAAVYTGALDNASLGKDSNAANHTRWAYLDLNYENELKRGDWGQAASFLNGFSEQDIRVRLDNFHGDLNRLQALHDGAVASVGPTSAAAIVTGSYISRLKLEARVAEMQKSGELTLPTSTTAGGTPGQPAYITIGQHAAGTPPSVAEADREPLSPDTDWSKDPAYIDNNIAQATYDILANRFQIIYADGGQADLDYDGVKKFAGTLPPPPPPPSIAAPAAGLTRPSPPPPPPTTTSTPVTGGPPPKTEATSTPAPVGEHGLYFKAKSTGRIYPTVFNKGTIPTISACALQIAQQEPAARERLKETMISVAVSARSVASATIAAGIKASLFSLGARRQSGAQFLLKNVDPAEVRASQQGYQVYEYFAEDGRCLYVGKAGGAGGTSPTTWVDRGWVHIAEKPEIAEASHIKVTSGLTEQEAFALEEVRIGAVRGGPGNLNTSPGEYTTRFGPDGLSANAASASKGQSYTFETDIVPYSPMPPKR